MEKINWYGTYTLIIREVGRFLKVYNQTIFAHVASTLIFLTVFILAFNSNKSDISGIKFINFIGYGLISMNIIQSAFSNSSSSFIMYKILGYITDILQSPLGSIEIVIALTIGAVLRGVLVGITISIFLIPFIEYSIYNPFLLIFYTIISGSLFGQIGLLLSIISNSYEQLAAITNFIITPLLFLSGTFFPPNILPVFAQNLNMINPLFYLIDGFRYSLTGYAYSSIILGTVLLIFLNFLIYCILIKLINIGWRIKT